MSFPRHALLKALRAAAPAALCLLAVPSAVGQEVVHDVASWPERGHGNHRAVLRVSEPAEAVRAHIEWRRRDRRPETKDIRVFDLHTGARVTNVVRVNVTRAAGDLVFQPVTAPGEYAVYYLPYDPPGTGPFGDAGNYHPPQETADAAWVRRHGLAPEALAAGGWRSLPQAELVAIQARGDFHRMDPMEVIATEEETAALLTRYPDRDYLLFAEDRTHPIRMFEDLPLRWVQRGPSAGFHGAAQPGEQYVFQIGVWACRAPIEDLAVELSALRSPAGGVIPATAFNCFNLGGTDARGRPLRRTVPVAQGVIRPLWVGVQVPRDAQGTYQGTVRVQPRGQPETALNLTLDVSGPILEDCGDGDLWRLSRLRWLDSTLGLDDEVIPPFTPLEVRGDTTRCLGREVTFDHTGLPHAIRSNGREVLAAPMSLVVETSRGREQWRPVGAQVTKAAAGVVERAHSVRGERLALAVASRMEADGCLTYRATLTAQRPTRITDIRLEAPLAEEVARYMMGMSRRGGHRPREWQWRWDPRRADNLVWLGDVDAGLQLKLTGPGETWNVVRLGEEGVPASWDNAGRGGCRISEQGDRVLVQAFTGERRLRAGEELELHFRLLVTPFKPIDPSHWNWRYGDVRADATVLHVHHGAHENPHINYPFSREAALAELVRSVKGIRSRRTAHGRLVYPAEGNLDPARGALHVWARVRFDPTVYAPGQARYNQGLFSLDWPNEDAVGFYWNIDDRGMRTYIRRGPPAHNRYPLLFGAPSPDWREADRRLLTLSWSDELAIFVDGRRLRAAPCSGLLRDDVQGARLVFQGGFDIAAIKVTDVPYAEGAPISPTPDEHTLLLDTFAAWDGGAQTRPERSADESEGTVEGVCDRAESDAGAALQFRWREEPVGPRGVNVYYTVGQLSNHAPELWALRSLGDEVFRTGGVSIYEDPRAADKPQKGYPWLREHLVTGYEPAWRTVLGEGEIDASIAMQPLSRWHNYYVEGMAWLMRRTGVDGLYLDGIGYDREIMKRVAKVMKRTNPDSRINFHSGDNWSPPWDQGRFVSAANNYMEHFPYLGNLWFGELFDYDMPPDYWLVEISGLPFGLTGEMLNYETGGNPYRGMLYGMSGRQHPSAPHVWRLWDDFDIQQAEMLGYWREECPVRTDDDRVLATVYRKPGEALVALAAWPDEPARRRAVAPPTPRPPGIDGRLDPGEWDAAARLTNFTLLGQDASAPDQTRAYVTWDHERLYLAFRCEQPGGAPRALATRRDDAVWEDDAVEVFMQPDPRQPDYYQFIGNSRGVFADAKGHDLSWDGPWEYRASVGEGYWEGEASIPLAALGITPPEGEAELAIGLNVCRDQQTPAHRLSAWSPAAMTFHDVSRFGEIVLSPHRPATREQPAQVDGDGGRIRRVRLLVDWRALGMSPERVTLTAPELPHFQQAAQFSPAETLPVEAGRGWLLVVREGAGQ